MYWRTKKLTQTIAMTDALLNALKTVPGAALLATPKIMLFVSGPDPVPGMVIGDYVEPTFHGYGADTITLAGPVKVGGFDRAMVASCNFVATTGGAIDDQVLGYLLVDTTKAILYGGEKFDAQFSFAAPGDFINIDFIFPLAGVYTPTVV